MKLHELKKRMKGVTVVLLTPFNKDGSLDLGGMRSNVHWLTERTIGKDFIFTPTGSSGEFYAMSTEECKAIIKMVVEEVKGRVIVMAGTAQAGTLETVKMCQYAESVGADGAQIVLPYYHIPFEEGMYLHYKTIAESVGPDFGITLYNNPAVSGSWIKPPLMKRLSKIPNIIAIKENTPDIAAYYTMQRTIDPEDMAIFCGLGELMFSFEAIYGCSGYVTILANFAPELTYSLYEAARDKDFKKVAEIINFIQPYLSFIAKAAEAHGPHTGIAASTRSGYIYFGIAKAAMDIIGLRGGEVRLPLIGLTEKERTKLLDVLKAIKVI